VQRDHAVQVERDVGLPQRGEPVERQADLLPLGGNVHNSAIANLFTHGKGDLDAPCDGLASLEPEAQRSVLTEIIVTEVNGDAYIDPGPVLQGVQGQLERPLSRFIVLDQPRSGMNPIMALPNGGRRVEAEDREGRGDGP